HDRQRAVEFVPQAEARSRGPARMAVARGRAAVADRRGEHRKLRTFMAHARDGASRLPAEHLKAGGVGWILDTEKTIAIVVKASPQETAPETLALPQRRHAGDHTIAGLGLPHQV